MIAGSYEIVLTLAALTLAMLFAGIVLFAQSIALWFDDWNS